MHGPAGHECRVVERGVREQRSEDAARGDLAGGLARITFVAVLAEEPRIGAALTPPASCAAGAAVPRS